MASEVKSITSESLEAAYRALTPSQSGFTQDLMASNTIIPVLDLTASASGSSIPEYLQQAIAFGSQTAFNVINTTTTLANTPGFYRVFGVGTVGFNNAVNRNVAFNLTDGLSIKIIWNINCPAYSATSTLALDFDFIVFLATGESLTGTSNSTVNALSGSTRQIADVNGTLVNPSGFTPQ